MQQAYYALLKWRADPARDECKNVAVILVSPRGDFGGIKYSPLGTLGTSLRSQGVLASMLDGLNKKFQQEVKPDAEWLNKLSQKFQERAIIVTEPTPALVEDPIATLNSLYKALVQVTE